MCGPTESVETVTVVIPSHNRRDLLSRTLDSVLRQCGVDVEVVIVDDGSSDGTSEAVESLGAKNVRLIRHVESKGVAAARNAGLEVAETPWVAFVDDDDIWAPDKLRAQLAAIAAEPPAAWSSVGAIHVNPDLNPILYAEPAPSGDVSRLLMSGDGIPGGGSGVLASTSLGRDVGGFDEELSILADWDFYLRLSLRSPIAAVDRPLLAYYIHYDSMYYNPDGIIAEFEYLEHKYASWPGVHMAIDYPIWYLRFIRMEIRKGNTRAAWDLLVRACGRSGGGLGSFARGVARWLYQKVRDRNMQSPKDHGDEVSAWVLRYREKQAFWRRPSDASRHTL